MADATASPVAHGARLNEKVQQHLVQLARNRAPKSVSCHSMDFTKIAHAVEVDHGVKRVSMHYLKQFVTPARERLSPELCQKISVALGELGLLTLPTTLPSSENEWVFVLSRDSALGQAVALSSAAFNMTKLDILPSSILDIRSNFPELANLLD